MHVLISVARSVGDTLPSQYFMYHVLTYYILIVWVIIMTNEVHRY